MKVFISFIIIGVVAFFAQSLGPWWIGVFIAFLVCGIAQMKPGAAFLAGFLGLGLMWGVSAGIMDQGNEGILSARIGELFGGLPGLGIVILTGLLGAIIGGMGGYSGAAGMKWIIGKP